MDTLYYSNHCKHCQKIIQFLVKNNLANKLNFLCIDQRKRDANNNNIYIILEDGRQVIMPPNVNSVPALLLIKDNYRVILGEDIIKRYQGVAQSQGQGPVSMHSPSQEPTGVSLMASNQGMNIISEPYTYYNLTAEELSAKGTGGRRQMYNYVPADVEVISISTPPDTYQPDKVAKSITVDVLQQKRNTEFQPSANNVVSPFVPKL
jgi:glutaredoxin-related protein